MFKGTHLNYIKFLGFAFLISGTESAVTCSRIWKACACVICQQFALFGFSI